MSEKNTVSGRLIGKDKNNGNGKIPLRQDIPSKYKWRLEDMFRDDTEWEAAFDALTSIGKSLSDYRGKLAESSETLKECLTTRDDVYARAEALYAYAKMRRDEDNSNDKYQALSDKAMSQLTAISAVCSYIAPELLSVGRNRVDELLKEDPKLGVYAHYFDELFRQSEHILSEREEELLALVSEPLSAADEIYTMLTNADLKFPDVEDENGNPSELTEGRYALFLENTDRAVRERAFLNLFNTYGKYRNTIGASLSSSIKKERFSATVRKYGSDIEMNLDSDKIPIRLYDNLIDTVGKNLGLLHRYLKLRKRALCLSELHMYDLYTPIVRDAIRAYSYEDAAMLVKNGVSPLGEEYCRDLEQAFTQGWIDVCENQNKTRGAYSFGTYRSHPYILLNFQGRVDDVLTLAHELGHSMHSYYTNGRQPYIYSGYKIFVAEVASTVNESLVQDYLAEIAVDKREKAYILNRRLESIRTTLFRQTMFAEFERSTHKMAQDGVALTPDTFSSVYMELNNKYYAAEVTVDPQIALEWARIPHFYRAFYVYQYATGISAALSLSCGIQGSGYTNTDAAKKYLNFLASGDSDYPLALLKNAGVDLTTPEPVENAMRCFENALDELETLI